MNRRDFIGAAIGALVAALALPFEEFAAWCKRWFSSNESVLLVGDTVNFELGQRLVIYSGMRCGKTLAFARSVRDTVTARIVKVDRLRGTITVDT